MNLDYDTYLSPFTWRYGSPAMRRLWSEAHKRRLWRQLWVTLAEVQSEYGLVQPNQLADLRSHMEEIDVGRALSVEAEIQHDLMAELRVFSEQAPVGGGILHLGATSMDIEDNADVLRIRQALDLILTSLRTLLLDFARQVETWADLPLIAFTHLQPAEPTTLGYRLAGYAQDLLLDWDALTSVRMSLHGKGFKGAVGTSASYAELLGVHKLDAFEQRLSEALELPFFPVASQVYPRKQDYTVISSLAGLGGSLYKFAFDLRLLQSPPIGEWAEPFGKKQVGSSAMPFKRNPISSEKINSLGRLLAQFPRIAWDNAAHSLLERTLDDSANRRTMLPEAFLISDELLRTASRLINGLVIHEGAIQRNLGLYGPFAAIERVLMASCKAGADRQVMHECLRQHSITAWAAVQAESANPLVELLAGDSELLHYLPESEIRKLMDGSTHVGDAAQRAQKLSAMVRATFQ